MEVHYPIYVLEKDDFSFREFGSTRDLEYCEREDVLSGLYEGWDSTGSHLVITWNEALDLPLAVADDERALTAFKQAVERYRSACKQGSIEFHGYRNPDSGALCDPEYLMGRINQIANQRPRT